MTAEEPALGRCSRHSPRVGELREVWRRRRARQLRALVGGEARDQDDSELIVLNVSGLWDAAWLKQQSQSRPSSRAGRLEFWEREQLRLGREEMAPQPPPGTAEATLCVHLSLSDTHTTCTNIPKPNLILSIIWRDVYFHFYR